MSRADPYLLKLDAADLLIAGDIIASSLEQTQIWSSPVHDSPASLWYAAARGVGMDLIDDSDEKALWAAYSSPLPHAYSEEPTDGEAEIDNEKAFLMTAPEADPSVPVPTYRNSHSLDCDDRKYPAEHSGSSENLASTSKIDLSSSPYAPRHLTARSPQSPNEALVTVPTTPAFPVPPLPLSVRSSKKRTAEEGPNAPPPKRKINLQFGKPLMQSIRDTGTGLNPVARFSMPWQNAGTPKVPGLFSKDKPQVMAAPQKVSEAETKRAADEEELLEQEVEDIYGYRAWDSMSHKQKDEQRRRRRRERLEVED
ncbi:hypothetical protein B0H11DRAFT_2255682 [Mycena galericulata]|nr:hypothetical protein B0H11DRAFT_2255682 [Mycena galericulata]